MVQRGAFWKPRKVFKTNQHPFEAPGTYFLPLGCVYFPARTVRRKMHVLEDLSGNPSKPEKCSPGSQGVGGASKNMFFYIKGGGFQTFQCIQIK